jgi:NADH-quinone oxidoreductase subunit M
MTAVFLLTLVQRVFSGPLNKRWANMPDLTLGEWCMLAPPIVVMFAVGLYPQVISGMVHGAVTQLVGLVRY